MSLLYVECHPDTVLVRTLGIPKREIRHVHSKGKFAIDSVKVEIQWA